MPACARSFARTVARVCTHVRVACSVPLTGQRHPVKGVHEKPQGPRPHSSVLPQSWVSGRGPGLQGAPTGPPPRSQRTRLILLTPFRAGRPGLPSTVHEAQRGRRGPPVGDPGDAVGRFQSLGGEGSGCVRPRPVPGLRSPPRRPRRAARADEWGAGGQAVLKQKVQLNSYSANYKKL